MKKISYLIFICIMFIVGLNTVSAGEVTLCEYVQTDGNQNYTVEYVYNTNNKTYKLNLVNKMTSVSTSYSLSLDEEFTECPSKGAGNMTINYSSASFSDACFMNNINNCSNNYKNEFSLIENNLENYITQQISAVESKLFYDIRIVILKEIDENIQPDGSLNSIDVDKIVNDTLALAFLELRDSQSKLPTFVTNSEIYKTAIEEMKNAIKNQIESMLHYYADDKNLTDEQRANLLDELDDIEDQVEESVDIYVKTVTDALFTVSGAGNCDTLLGDIDEPAEAGYWIFLILDWMKYAAIVALIALSVLEFLRAVSSQDADALVGATKKTALRLVYVVLIFLFPILLEFLFELFGIVNGNSCTITQ